MSYLSTPPTPPAKRAPSASSQRKASDLSEKSPPRTTAAAFLKWRLADIDAQVEIIERIIQDYRANTKEDQSHLNAATEDLETKRSELERELVLLHKQQRFIKEDIQDSTKALEDAYAEALYISWRRASEEGQRQFKNKALLPRDKFKKLCSEYLDARKQICSVAPIQIWCHVLGWLPLDMVKCAHIVPFCFDCKELSYMFGTDDAALSSCRNGLFLNKFIERGWDNGWAAIIPDGSVETTPTEWKLVLLNESIRKNTVYNPGQKGAPIVRWNDIDGQRLRFRNENRPARRYLYFRYIMTYIHGIKYQYPNFKEKLPSGTIWASPRKPDGYLRKSVLRALVERVGDVSLPQELIAAGTFLDTESSSGRDIEDKKAVIELSARIKDKENGLLRDEVDDEDSDEGDDEDSDEENE